MKKKTKQAMVAGIVASSVLGAFTIACSSSSSSSSSGATLGSPCQQDTDCASSSRGTVACFIGGLGNGYSGTEGGGGGGGGGGGDGGNAGKTWCSLKCTPDNAAQLCGAPFDGICNPRGYCRLD